MKEVLNYIDEVETRVAGIPCLIGVIEYESVGGSYDYHAASDCDYYGYTESSWIVLDRRSRPAPWLAKKLTDKDRSRIDGELVRHFED